MSDPTAAEPWTVTLAWSPDQNGGRVSVLDGRAPLHAVVGRIWAGEPLDEVAQDFGLTAEQVRVLAELADEVTGWD